MKDFPVQLPAEKRAMERAYISAALKRTRGSITRAARLLGIGRSTLTMKLRKYRIEGDPIHVEGRSETEAG